MDGQPALRILTREEHCLSRQTIDPDALKVLYRLQGHGFMAYLVGGCVRDLLLGKAPKDFDVVTNAHPQQIRELFRNSRLIGRRFRLAHVYFQGGKIIEVSTFRRRSEFDENGDNGHPRDDNTFGTPAEDALRRDITINGIFYNLSDFSLLDYVGGLEDLKQGTIRCIGDPEEKFMQDPVRMLRVIRHAARTGFSIEERTYVSLLRHVEKLRLCSPARVRDEFLRELKEGSVTESMRHMVATGMLWALFPPFVAPLADAGMRRLFFKLLEELDRLGADGTAADEVSLSLFLLPLIPFYCPFQDFPPGRRGQAAFQHKIRDWVLEVLGPHQFTRQAKEATAHLLGAQRIFHEFHPGGSFPRRFMQRSYFSQARQVFEIAARVQGDLPQVFPLECGAGKSVGRKRRRRRKKRSAGGGAAMLHREGAPAPGDGDARSGPRETGFLLQDPSSKP